MHPNTYIYLCSIEIVKYLQTKKQTYDSENKLHWKTLTKQVSLDSCIHLMIMLLLIPIKIIHKSNPLTNSFTHKKTINAFIKKSENRLRRNHNININKITHDKRAGWGTLQATSRCSLKTNQPTTVIKTRFAAKKLKV